jgi:hypothetical protein
MKRTKILSCCITLFRHLKVFMLMLLLSVAGSNCRKHNVIPEDVETKGKIMIKGRIPAGKKYQDSLTLADAANVLIFHPGTYSNRTEYRIIAIDDGEFSSELKMSTGIAVVFLNEDYKYIGNLYTEGLNMLPLGNLMNKDQTVIDLLTLSLDGNHVIPYHNPLGSEILITTPEMECFMKLGEDFESLAKNIDTDNDESADILFSKHLIVSTTFRMFLGRWGCDDTMAASVENSDLYLNHLLTVEGGVDYSVSNDDIILSGPADSSYQDIKIYQCTINPNQNASFIAQFIRETPSSPDAPWDSDFLPFKKGIYTLSISGSTNLTFKYSNTEAKNYNPYIAHQR